MSGDESEKNMGTSEILLPTENKVDTDDYVVPAATREVTGIDCLARALCLCCSYLLILVTLPLALPFLFKCPKEHQGAVIFRLGRLRSKKSFGPGLIHVVPCADSCHIVDLRLQSFDVPQQEIMSTDGVTVTVDAIVYYRVIDAVAAVNNIQDYGVAARMLAATSLRTSLGTKTLSEMLNEQEAISATIADLLHTVTSNWGVDIQRVEITDVKLPSQMQKSMDAETEAQRYIRSKVRIAVTDGEEARSLWTLKETDEVVHEAPKPNFDRFSPIFEDLGAKNMRIHNERKSAGDVFGNEDTQFDSAIQANSEEKMKMQRHNTYYALSLDTKPFKTEYSYVNGQSYSSIL